MDASLTLDPSPVVLAHGAILKQVSHDMIHLVKCGQSAAEHDLLDLLSLRDRLPNIKVKGNYQKNTYQEHFDNSHRMRFSAIPEDSLHYHCVRPIQWQQLGKALDELLGESN